MNSPVQVDLFRIWKARIDRGGVTCLWITFDTGGDIGIIKRRAEDKRGWFNPWSMLRLDSDWEIIWED